MASSAGDDDRQNSYEDTPNPFVAFRRFADEQMSYLVNGVFGLSSAVGSSPRRRSVEDYDRWLKEARESRERRTSEAEEAGHIMEVYRKAHQEGTEPTHNNDQNLTRDGDESMRCPYRPTDQKMPSSEEWPFSVAGSWDETSDASSSAAFASCLRRALLMPPTFGEERPAAPIWYILHSPYSPVRLEHDDYLRDHGAKWREAFEDLLAVQNGQSLPPRSEGSRQVPESAVDWVRGMVDMAICKGEQELDESEEKIHKSIWDLARSPTLLSAFTALGQNHGPRGEDEDVNHSPFNGDYEDQDDDEEFTELDLYDRFLGSQNQPSPRESPHHTNSTSRTSAHLQQDLGPVNATNTEKPSVLSTLTTTERTTLQDGSVHTKVVLKKRFSDGREEHTETVHTQKAQKPGQGPSPSNASKERETAKAEGKESKVDKKGGWFWS